jgi:hypothetical protein
MKEIKNFSKEFVKKSCQELAGCLILSFQENEDMAKMLKTREFCSNKEPFKSSRPYQPFLIDP